MYLPKNQYRIKYTNGNEFTNSSNEEFIGSYIETASGISFNGDSLSGRKEVINSTAKQQVEGIDRPYNDYFGPTEKDYENGFYTRYFLRIRNGKFIEVSRSQWIEKRNRKRVTPGQLRWILNGPVKDGSVNGIPFKGASTKNRETLQRLEKDFPGIADFFKSTSEFVR